MYQVRLFLISVAVLQVMSLNGVAQASYNLQTTGIFTDKSDIVPGESVNLTYQLRANAPLFGRLDMAVFVRKGPRGIWAAEWSIPSSEESMKNGVLTRTRSIHVPQWGEGVYYISVHANKSHFLGESDYSDNSREISVRGVIPRENGDTSEEVPLLGDLSYYPHTMQCGMHTLKVLLERETIWPGADMNVKARLQHKLDPQPDAHLKITADGGSFTKTKRDSVTGVTDHNGTVEEVWQAPEYPGGGTGEVQHNLEVSVLSGIDEPCTMQIPVVVTW